MPASNGRSLEPTAQAFLSGATVKAQPITQIEGLDMGGDGILTLKPLIVGKEVMYIEAFKQKGMVDAVHNHPDHESLGYLVKGRLRLVIGGEEFIAEAGDSWVHGRGVPHYSEALEDSIQLEVKTPPCKTW